MSVNKPLVGNVLIAEDHPLYAKGLEKVLIDDAIATLVFIVPNGKEALATARKHQIDLAFIDCGLPFIDGITCTQQLKDLFPVIKIISMSGTCSYEKVTGAFDAGTDGYLTKECDEENIRAFIISVLNNEKPLSAPAKEALTQQMVASLSATRKKEFTDREKEIGYVFSKGKTDKYTGETLFISTSTVKTHKERMFEKTGTDNKASLVAFMIESKVFENYIFPYKML